MNSIKQKILQYLNEKPQWHFGGELERWMRQVDPAKMSNISRRLRELVQEGKIEAQYVNVPGVANKVVQYRIKQDEISGFKILSDKPFFIHHPDGTIEKFKANIKKLPK